MPRSKDPRNLQVVDQLLTSVARAFKPEGYIYNEICPTIPVEKDSGLYPIFDNLFDDDVDSKVADRAETPEVDFEYSTDTYLAESYRLKASITRHEEEQAASIIPLRRLKTQHVLTRMALRRERRLAALLRKTTNNGALTLGGGVSNKWDVAAATIEADIKAAQIAIRDACGMLPNTIVIPWNVAYAIAVQEDIREIVKYTVPGDRILVEGAAMLPPVLHGLRVVVPRAMVNTAGEGAAKSLSNVWSDNVVLLHVAQGAGWGVPSTCYSFKAKPEVVDRWDENDPPVEYVRAWERVDEKVCAPALGYEITDVLT